MRARDKLIVALDVDTAEKALKIVDILKKDIKFFKIGLELFSSSGPDIVTKVKALGLEVFLDLKLHDIPNTVAKTSANLTRLGVYMFNVHALGGFEMMKRASDAARDEAKRHNITKPKILGVTILTSMDENGLKKVGIGVNMTDEVLNLACLAKEAELDGVVASVKEAAVIKKEVGKDFLIVTPGVRLSPQPGRFGCCMPQPNRPGCGGDDQKRAATPKEAIASGADFIVIGRPILEAPDPLLAARRILEEIK